METSFIVVRNDKISHRMLDWFSWRFNPLSATKELNEGAWLSGIQKTLNLIKIAARGRGWNKKFTRLKVSLSCWNNWLSNDGKCCRNLSQSGLILTWVASQLGEDNKTNEKNYGWMALIRLACRISFSLHVLRCLCYGAHSYYCSAFANKIILFNCNCLWI